MTSPASEPRRRSRSRRAIERAPVGLVGVALMVWAASEPVLLGVEDPVREVALGLLVAAPLLARRRAPLRAASATLAAILLQQALGAGGTPLHASLACALLAGHALGTVAARRVARDRPRSPVADGDDGTLAAEQLLLARALARPAGRSLWGFGVAAAFVLAGPIAWGAGVADVPLDRAVAFAGALVGGLALSYFPRDRAARAEVLKAEVVRLEAALAGELTVASEEERGVIAEQLASLVSRVAVRAEDLDAGGQDAGAAALALKEAQRSARAAMDELRKLLDVLHHPPLPDPPAEPPLSLRARVARLHLRYGPVVVFAAIGVVEQLMLPERPARADGGVMVPAPPYGTGVAAALACLTALPLLVRHRAPLIAVGLCGAFLVVRTGVADLSSLTFSQSALGIGLAFTAGGYARNTNEAVLGGLIAAAVTVAAWVLEQAPISVFEWSYLAVLLVAAWEAGRRMSVHLTAAAQGRSELTLLAHRRHELVCEAAALERRLVAREVHDLVGHGLSLMSMHAAVSAARLERGEDPVGEAVGRVRALAEETERELQVLLEVLRGPRTADRPDPGELRRLVEDARRHGHPVELVGGDTPVPPEIAAAVVDVVRESLTNVRKHAGPVPTEVVLDHPGGAVEVRVVNAPGHGAPGPGNRSGLEGLRERVGALGGEFTAGPTDAGGWALCCRIPSSASHSR